MRVDQHDLIPADVVVVNDVIATVQDVVVPPNVIIIVVSLRET